MDFLNLIFNYWLGLFHQIDELGFFQGFPIFHVWLVNNWSNFKVLSPLIRVVYELNDFPIPKIALICKINGFSELVAFQDFSAIWLIGTVLSTEFLKQLIVVFLGFVELFDLFVGGDLLESIQSAFQISFRDILVEIGLELSIFVFVDVEENVNDDAKVDSWQLQFHLGEGEVVHDGFGQKFDVDGFKISCVVVDL